MKIEEIENLTLGIGTFKKFTNNLAFASAVSSQCKLRSHLETLLACTMHIVLFNHKAPSPAIPTRHNFTHRIRISQKHRHFAVVGTA
jgi:hypothetical protein